MANVEFNKLKNRHAGTFLKKKKRKQGENS